MSDALSRGDLYTIANKRRAIIKTYIGERRKTVVISKKNMIIRRKKRHEKHYKEKRYISYI